MTLVGKTGGETFDSPQSFLRVAASEARTLDADGTEPQGNLPPRGEERTAPLAGASDVLERGYELGRYLILHHLGSGGMGVVYAAYDPDLDRKVAVKLLHGDRSGPTSGGRGQARLLREARAMAKLHARNVVSVYDIGTVDGRVYVAMEFIEGQTLRRWLKAKGRDWGEVIAVFRQIGDGLTAVHHIGLVHRDLKPDNVMISSEGRAVVMDFGLVSSDSEQTPRRLIALDQREVGETTQESGAHSSESLTRTGAVLGTPAYMSPEQHLGFPADARSDQFAFCVVLYEAAYGQRPFAGASVAALAFEISEGNMRTPPKREGIPSAVAEILRRGLSPDADDRYDSIAELLSEIEPDPPRSRAPFFAVVAIAVGMSLIAGFSGGAPQVCATAGDEVDAVWNAEARVAIQEAFLGTERSYAAGTLSRVEARFDGYAASWKAGKRDSCEASNLRHEQSDELLDQRMACLDGRLRTMGALLVSFENADADLVSKAVNAAHGLPGIEACADRAALLGAVPPPRDPEAAKIVEDLRADLADAEMLRIAGRYEAARQAVDKLLEVAQGVDYPPLEAELLLFSGVMAKDLGNKNKAVDALSRSQWLARASSHDEIVGRAAVQLMRFAERQDQRSTIWQGQAEAEVERSNNPELKEGYLVAQGMILDEAGEYEKARAAYLEAAGLIEAREGSEHPALPAALNNAAGSLYSLGEISRARAEFEEVITKMEAVYGPKHPRVGVAYGNLSMVCGSLGELDAAVRYARRALQIKQEAHGSEHPSVGIACKSLGQALLAQSKYDEAEQLHKRALTIAQAHADGPTWDVAAAEMGLGRLESYRRRYAQALTHHERSLNLLVTMYGSEHAIVADGLDNVGEALQGLGRWSEAQTKHSRALALREAAQGANHPDLAYSLTNLARGYMALGEPALAEPLGRRALELRAGAGVPEEKAHVNFILARARFALGHPREARELATTARSQCAPHGFASCADVDTWLGEPGPG